MSEKNKKSTAAPIEVVKTPGATAAVETKALALFNTPTGLDLSKLKRRNMPRMVKPESVPVGAIVSGEIIAILNSPTTTIKGKLLHLKHASGEEFTFPCTGAIRQALAPGVKGDDAAGDKELTAILTKEVGKLFYAQRQEDGQSATYKKKMFVFDVFTQDK